MKRGSVWVSFAVLWSSYSLLFLGYCWLRGYGISFLETVSPVNYYQGPWPPPLFGGTGVVPSSVQKEATQAAKTAQAQGRPLPGSVQSRL